MSANNDIRKFNWLDRYGVTALDMDNFQKWLFDNQAALAQSVYTGATILKGRSVSLASGMAVNISAGISVTDNGEMLISDANATTLVANPSQILWALVVDRPLKTNMTTITDPTTPNTTTTLHIKQGTQTQIIYGTPGSAAYPTISDENTVVLFGVKMSAGQATLLVGNLDLTVADAKTFGDITVSNLRITGLTANRVVLTDNNSNLTTNTWSVANANNAFVVRDSNGDVNCSRGTFTSLIVSNLAVSQVVVTNAGNLISSVAYGSNNVANTFVFRDSNGDTSIRNLVAVGATFSGLSANYIVGTDGSKGLVSVNYGVNGTPSALALRDANGDCGFHNLNVSALNANQIVATDASKYLTSIPYSAANTANTLVLRDSNGDGFFRNINLSLLASTSNVLIPSLSGQLSTMAYSSAIVFSSIVSRDSSGKTSVSYLTSGSGLNNPAVAVGKISLTLPAGQTSVQTAIPLVPERIKSIHGSFTIGNGLVKVAVPGPLELGRYCRISWDSTRILVAQLDSSGSGATVAYACDIDLFIEYEAI